MIDFAITSLVIAIAVATVFQPNAARLFAALVFSIVIISHDLILFDLDGLAYYASAALFSLLIIILTSGINPAPEMVITLHKVCIASIIANAAGWVLWFLYVPPTYYNLSLVLIFGWAFFTLTKRDSRDVGGFSISCWRACFRFNSNPIYLHIFKDEGKI